MLLTVFAQLFRPRQAAPAARVEVSRHLFEAAEARAGMDPRQALELRRAACAALRVVR